MKHTFEIELDGETVLEDSGRWYGASVVMFEVEYYINYVERADTPFGPVPGQELVITNIEGTVYAADQDGGEIETHLDWNDFISESRVYDELDELI